MPTLYVIIPYYQNKAGILRRALRSIAVQEIPSDWLIVVNVVDDGSPHPASKELAGIDFGPVIDVRIFCQQNRGVSAARNAGLNCVSEQAALIAYLDSDDTWPQGHLACAIRAYENGYDFYFCDNSRPNHHESTFALSEMTSELVSSSAGRSEGEYIDIPRRQLPRMIIKEFPTNISTVIHAAAIGKGIRFETRLRCACEDVVYLTTIATHSKNACVNPEKMVSCGAGVNIYHGSLDWDHSSFMAIRRDSVIGYSLIVGIHSLADDTKAVARFELKRYRSDFVFHLLRRVYRKRDKVPKEFFDLMRRDPRFVFWFPVSLLRVLRYYDV
ncbi:MAG: glycosyltransferase family 2 protein [Puniceicoccaceae bacterium]|nr:MAG: glycosyltransferase family 2 protein [Puniceicoccaceae bacterium]